MTTEQRAMLGDKEDEAVDILLKRLEVLHNG